MKSKVSEFAGNTNLLENLKKKIKNKDFNYDKNGEWLESVEIGY